MLSLTDRDRAFVIAEAGTNHAHPDPNKRLRRALRYVDAAARAGASAVKFQWFHAPNPETMFCWIEGDEERAPRWHLSVLPPSQWQMVKDRAEVLNMVFLASTFEQSTVQWLNKLGMEATKVASRAATTFPYEGAPKPFLISTGMSEELAQATKKLGRNDFYLLQCEANYPSTTPWGGVWGFSDHSGSPFLGIDAISRGCKLLEVHFCIEEMDAGPDLPACLNLSELKVVCQARDYYAERKAA